MKPRYVYLLTPPADHAGGVELYSNLEALAADKASGLTATTAAIRAARKQTGGYPVTVKGWQIDKKILKGKPDATLPQDLA